MVVGARAPAPGRPAGDLGVSTGVGHRVPCASRFVAEKPTQGPGVFTPSRVLRSFSGVGVPVAGGPDGSPTQDVKTPPVAGRPRPFITVGPRVGGGVDGGTVAMEDAGPELPDTVTEAPVPPLLTSTGVQTGRRASIRCPDTLDRGPFLILPTQESFVQDTTCG